MFWGLFLQQLRAENNLVIIIQNCNHKRVTNNRTKHDSKVSHCIIPIYKGIIMAYFLSSSSLLSNPTVAPKWGERSKGRTIILFGILYGSTAERGWNNPTEETHFIQLVKHPIHCSWSSMNRIQFSFKNRNVYIIYTKCINGTEVNTNVFHCSCTKQEKTLLKQKA